jgi:hypothetical protein
MFEDKVRSLLYECSTGKVLHLGRLQTPTLTQKLYKRLEMPAREKGNH